MKLSSYIWGMKALFNYNVDYNRSESGVIIPHYVNIERCVGGDTCIHPNHAVLFTLAFLFGCFVGYGFYRIWLRKS